MKACQRSREVLHRQVKVMVEYPIQTETMLQGNRAMVLGMIQRGKKAESAGGDATQHWKLEELAVQGNSCEVEFEHGGACPKQQAAEHHSMKGPQRGLDDIVE
jgi:hypothetical protein